jgi:predicted nuclease with TOPRIM domain
MQIRILKEREAENFHDKLCEENPEYSKLNDELEGLDEEYNNLINELDWVINKRSNVEDQMKKLRIKLIRPISAYN